MPGNGLIADLDNPLGNGLLHLAASLAKAQASRRNTDDWVAEQARRREEKRQYRQERIQDREAGWKREDERRAADQKRAKEEKEADQKRVDEKETAKEKKATTKDTEVQQRHAAEDIVRAWTMGAEMGEEPPSAEGGPEHPLVSTYRPALTVRAAAKAAEIKRALVEKAMEKRNKYGEAEEKVVGGNLLMGARRTKPGGMGEALVEALGVDPAVVGTRRPEAAGGSGKDIDKKLKLAGEILDNPQASEEEVKWAKGVRRGFMGLPPEAENAAEDAAEGGQEEPGFLSMRRTGAPGKWSLGDVLSMRWMAPETLGLNDRASATETGPTQRQEQAALNPAPAETGGEPGWLDGMALGGWGGAGAYGPSSTPHERSGKRAPAQVKPAETVMEAYLRNGGGIPENQGVTVDEILDPQKQIAAIQKLEPITRWQTIQALKRMRDEKALTHANAR